MSHTINDQELDSIEGACVLLAYAFEGRIIRDVAVTELLAIVERCRPMGVPEGAQMDADEPLDAPRGHSVAASRGVA